jgi:hypothetical protein
VRPTRSTQSKSRPAKAKPAARKRPRS